MASVTFGLYERHERVSLSSDTRHAVSVDVRICMLVNMSDCGQLLGVDMYLEGISGSVGGPLLSRRGSTA